MKESRIAAVALTTAIWLPGCYTTSTYSRVIDSGSPPPRAWYLEGTVETIREVVRRTEGDPAAGAFAGSLVGALLGHALTGSGGGALVGAVGGAAAGAAVSQGSAEQRYYEVLVRFDDGSRGRMAYSSPPAWRPGDRVRQAPWGLEWLGNRPRSQKPAMPLPPREPPPPPPEVVPPPPGG